MCNKTGYGLIIGIAASAATIAIGSAWQLATRYGVTTTLTPFDLALLRYLIPAILLSPVLVKHGLFPTLQTQWSIPLIVGGAGLPFGLLGMAGAQYAPAAHMGALLPGAMPFFVAIFCIALLKESFSIDRLVGLGTIFMGVALIFGTSMWDERSLMQSDIWKGHILFILAGCLWAIYTVAYRKSGLMPWHAASLICFWSSLLTIPAWLLSEKNQLLTAPLADIALQVGVQGILAGMIGLATYAISIRYLGAAIAAVSGALVPPTTSIGAAILLSEPITVMITLGVGAITLGVALFSGIVGLIIRNW